MKSFITNIRKGSTEKMPPVSRALELKILLDFRDVISQASIVYCSEPIQTY